MSYCDDCGTTSRDTTISCWAHSLRQEEAAGVRAKRDQATCQLGLPKSVRNLVSRCVVQVADVARAQRRPSRVSFASPRPGTRRSCSLILSPHFSKVLQQSPAAMCGANGFIELTASCNAEALVAVISRFVADACFMILLSYLRHCRAPLDER